MQFSIQQWKRFYDKIQSLGDVLKDSRPDSRGNPAVRPLGKHTQLNIEHEIKSLIKRVTFYLDQNNMKSRPALWQYKGEDKTTWESHESFEYSHKRVMISRRVTLKYSASHTKDIFDNARVS